MGLDPRLQLVMDRPQRQVALQGLERLLHLDQAHIELPELRRVAVGEVRPQQVPPLAAAHLAEGGAVEGDREGAIRMRRHLD